MYSERRSRASGRREVQRHAVDTIAQPGRRWAIGEDVSEMTAASGAMNLGAHHAMAAIDLFFYGAFDGHGKAGPARAAFEFQLGFEQGSVTARAGERSRALLM